MMGRKCRTGTFVCDRWDLNLDLHGAEARQPHSGGANIIPLRPLLLLGIHRRESGRTISASPFVSIVAGKPKMRGRIGQALHGTSMNSHASESSFQQIKAFALLSPSKPFVFDGLRIFVTVNVSEVEVTGLCPPSIGTTLSTVPLPAVEAIAAYNCERHILARC